MQCFAQALDALFPNFRTSYSTLDFLSYQMDFSHAFQHLAKSTHFFRTFVIGQHFGFNLLLCQYVIRPCCIDFGLRNSAQDFESITILLSAEL